MDSMDNFRERFEALAQQTEHLQPHTRSVERRRWWRLPRWVAAMAALGLALALPLSVQAETFRCRAGDVPCLIDAINAANANGDANTIRLAAGSYTLTVPDNPGNGLPVITSPLTITGRGADTTSIERDASAPSFRILGVAPTGSLTLQRLTLRGGTSLVGGGIANGGTLTLVRTTVTDNTVTFGNGGGISNGGTLTLLHSAVTSNGGGPRCFLGGGISTSGTATIAYSTIAGNRCALFAGGLYIRGGTVTLHASTVTDNFAQDAGGGIANGGFGSEDPGGTVIITESAITHNVSAVGAGIENNGLMVITNTTIAANEGNLVFGRGSGIANFDGTLLLTNSTLAENISLFFGPPFDAEALSNDSGTVLLANTILARNTNRSGTDTGCSGTITSLANNLIGNPTRCPIPLQPSDLTGDPGLGPFTDNGRPGKGHFPLLPTSQAIDAGSDAVCPRTDQLGRRRIGPCDIGAIEFRDRDDRQPDEDQTTAAH